MPLCFYERPAFVPLFTNGEKSKENCCFYEKKERNENSVQHLFGSQPSHYGDSVHPPVCTQQRDWLAPAPLEPQPASCLVASNCDCALSLFVLCISKMCPKVSEKPKRACKGVMLSIIKLVFYVSVFNYGQWNKDIVCVEFWVWECSEFTP